MYSIVSYRANELMAGNLSDQDHGCMADVIRTRDNENQSK